MNRITIAAFRSSYYRRAFSRLAVAVTLLSSFAFASVSAQAASEQIDVEQTDVEKLTQLLQQMDKFQADFEQIVVDERGAMIDESSGNFMLMRPHYFRWEIVEPYSQVLAADGTDLWSYDADIEQATVYSLADGLGATPASLLANDELDISKDYEVEEVVDPDTYEIYFELKPKDPDTLFEKLIMIFSDDLLSELRVNDNLGQSTYVKFTEIVIGPDMDESNFKLVIPDGVDVIDSRSQPEIDDAERL